MGNGDVRDYNIRTVAAAVLYDTSTRCTYSSLEPLVPGAAYLVLSGRVDMLTSPVPAARAAVATVSDTYVEVWELGFIFTHPPEDEKRKKT